MEKVKYMKRIDFENGTITNNILNAAIPMLVAQILSLLYNIVDRVYIARIPDVGTNALGAVGLCFPIIMIMTAFSNLFGSGGAPLFSIKRGMGDEKSANTIMNTSFTMLCGSAIILMCICLLFAAPLLTLFGASDTALKYAYPYLCIYLIGTLPSMIATGMNPFINAQGYSTIGMLSVAIGAIANLILDPVFIFILNLGIKGAAKFYLDDFGTGYSNLERIIGCPFNTIKFDKTLLYKSLDNSAVSDIVSHLTSVFKEQGFVLLIEGVENEEQASYSIDKGFDYIQGYKYAKPQPVINLKDYFDKLERAIS